MDPILLKPPWICPTLAEPQGWGTFCCGNSNRVAAFDSILFRLKAAPSERCKWEGDSMVTMKRPTIKLLIVCICSYMLLFGVSSSLKAQEPSGSTVTFYVQWYDVGKKALEGLEGVSKVTKGFRYFREINTVNYDPTVITVEEMEGALKKAGTYVETKKSPWFFVGVINPINRRAPLEGKEEILTS